MTPRSGPPERNGPRLRVVPDGDEARYDDRRARLDRVTGRTPSGAAAGRTPRARDGRERADSSGRGAGSRTPRDGRARPDSGGTRVPPDGRVRADSAGSRAPRDGRVRADSAGSRAPRDGRVRADGGGTRVPREARAGDSRVRADSAGARVPRGTRGNGRVRADGGGARVPRDARAGDRRVRAGGPSAGVGRARGADGHVRADRAAGADRGGRPGGADRSRTAGVPRQRTAASRPRPGGPRRRPPRKHTLALGDPRGRLRVSAVLFAVLLLVVAGRLVWLQGFQSKTYASKAEDQRLRVAPLPASRGAITDRNGATFAEDVDARDVYGDPSQVTDKKGTATKLAGLLHAQEATLQALLSRPGRFAQLAVGITPELGDQISKLDLPGIALVPKQRRVYPEKQLAAGVIGFTTLDADGREMGRGGLELQYDGLLRGTDGKERVEEDGAGVPIPLGVHHEVEPKPGTGVELTLDGDIQWKAQGAIAKTVKDTKADNGTVIVQDPQTGEILAMASAPSYDPNHIQAHDPLDNPATGDVYEPGSVNKVITMAEGLEHKVITPTSPITVPPTLPITSSYTLHDDETHGTEYLTATGVLAKSSNIGTVEIARKLGSGRLLQGLHAFGLGQQTAVHFPGESDGVIPPAPWQIATATTIPFGQGMSATALQMSTVYATIANGGVRVEPKLVKATVAADGRVTPTAPSPATRVVSPATATAVSRMLEAVVSKSGTAPAAQIDGYRVAGKTGTANRAAKGGYSGYTASFVGFAPADKPRLLVEVVLDNPKAGHYGGAVAAPVFQQVMSFALQSLRIPPTGTASPTIPLETR